MTKSEMKIFRGVLEYKQTQLGNGNKNRETLAIESSADELDRIQRASDRDQLIGNLVRNSDCLRDVRNALHRVDAGTFGICVGCEESISPKRLAAVPWASSCITCQETLDRGQEMRSEIDHSLVMAA